MSLISIDIVITFLWIACSVIVILVGLIAEFRMGTYGWMIVVGGLLLLAVSVFRIHPALTLAGLGKDVITLRQDLAFQKRISERLAAAELAAQKTSESERRIATDTRNEQTKTRMELAQALADLQKARSDNRAIASQLDAEKKTLSEHIRRHSETTARATTRENELISELTIVKREIQVAKLKTTHERETTPENSILDRASKGSKPSYTIQKIPQQELIQDLQGHYYLIKLRNPTNGQPIEFPLSRFAMEQNETALIEALSELNKDILVTLPHTERPAIYIRGKANNISFKNPKFLQNQHRDYSEIVYLPKSAEYFDYAKLPVTQKITGAFTNAELPNLRALYIKLLSEQLYSTYNIAILEGEFTSIDQNDLSFDIILHCQEARC